MLRGLCASLDIVYPYLKTTAQIAAKTLIDVVPKEIQMQKLIYPETLVVSKEDDKSLAPDLNDKIQSFIYTIDSKEILGK